MSTEIRVPQLPESVADATLVAWRKKPGEAVSRDENLADLETDKVVLEVPAPANGVLKELRVSQGSTVTGASTHSPILSTSGASPRRIWGSHDTHSKGARMAAIVSTSTRLVRRS